MARSGGRGLCVALVRPPLVVSRWSYAGTLTPPLGVAYVAAALEEAGHVVSIVDAIGEAPSRATEAFDAHLILGLDAEQIADRIDPNVDVIGVTCMFSSDWPYTRRVLRALRRRFPRALLVAGGEHVSAVPEQTLLRTPELDCLVLGEGEETAAALLEPHSGGRPLSEVVGVAHRDTWGRVQASRRARIRSIDAIPRPAWHLVPVDSYVRHQLGFGLRRGISMPVLASRGCPYRCTFCSSPQMWTTRWRPRDPDLLLDEIEGYMERYGATNFDFYDLTAIVDRRWILRFVESIERRGLRFTWQLPSGTRSEAVDAEVAAALARSGCVYLAYSPESGSKRLLREVKKRVDLESMKESMIVASRNGVIVKANLIMGLPGETRRDVRETFGLIAWMARNGVSDISIAPFAPYPGSELFFRVDAERGGALSTDEFYLSLTAQTDLTQNHSFNAEMSSHELAAYRAAGHALFYASIFLRRPSRMLETLSGLASEQQRTVLDKAIEGFVQRQTARLRAQP